MRRVLDQPNRRRGQRGERALGAGHEGRDVEAVLGQQVLEAVAGDLTAERPELGTDRAEVVGDDGLQPIEHRRRGLAGAEGEPLPRHRHGIEPDDVVGRAPVRQRARAAGVVADHPADRAPGVGRRVRAEAQPLRRGRALQHGVHRARIDACRTRFGVDLVHAVEVAEKSSTTPVPTALPAIDVPAPRDVSGVPVVRHASIVASTSSTERGRTTTCGTTR